MRLQVTYLSMYHALAAPSHAHPACQTFAAIKAKQQQKARLKSIWSVLQHSCMQNALNPTMPSALASAYRRVYSFWVSPPLLGPHGSNTCCCAGPTTKPWKTPHHNYCGLLYTCCRYFPSCLPSPSTLRQRAPSVLRDSIQKHTQGHSWSVAGMSLLAATYRQSLWIPTARHSWQWRDAWAKHGPAHCSCLV